MKSISGKQVKLWRRGAGFYRELPEATEEQKILCIPVHRNQDLKIGTLKALMKVANLTEDDL